MSDISQFASSSMMMNRAQQTQQATMSSRIQGQMASESRKKPSELHQIIDDVRFSDEARRGTAVEPERALPQLGMAFGGDSFGGVDSAGIGSFGELGSRPEHHCSDD